MRRAMSSTTARGASTKIPTSGVSDTAAAMAPAVSTST
jgi:hypothetical protein